MTRKEITEKLLANIASAKSNKALLQTTQAFKQFVEGLEVEDYVEPTKEVAVEEAEPRVLVERGDPNNPNPVGVWGQAPMCDPNPKPRDPGLAPVPGSGTSGPKIK